MPSQFLPIFLPVLSLLYCLIAGDLRLSRKPDITNEDSRLVVCSKYADLRLYSGSNLAAVIRQFNNQLSRDDPSEEFKVCWLFDFQDKNVKQSYKMSSF